MAHLAGYCNCGKKIHFPKNATLGDTWRCYKCGKTWTLSTHGKALKREKSLPPPKNESYCYDPSVSDSFDSGEWVGWVIVGAIVLFFMYACR